MHMAQAAEEEYRFEIHTTPSGMQVIRTNGEYELPPDAEQLMREGSMLTDRGLFGVAREHRMSELGLENLMARSGAILDIGTGRSSLYQSVDRPGRLISLDLLMPQQVEFPHTVHPWLVAS